MLRINQPVPLSRPSLFGFRSSVLFSVLVRLFVASPLALPSSLRRRPFPLPAVVSPRIARTRAPPIRSHAPNIALIFRAIACATEVGRSHTCQSSRVYRFGQLERGPKHAALVLAPLAITAGK